VHQGKNAESGEKNNQPLDEFHRGHRPQRPELPGVRIMRMREF